LSGFTLEAVARRAGVARFTVYYQFGSKRGLIEALFDDLAARGGIRRMVQVHALPDPDDALRELFVVFGDFWATDRVIMRRVRSLAALDADLEQAVRTRDGWRASHCRRILERLAVRSAGTEALRIDLLVNVLNTLSSFETFDALAGTDSSNLEAVAPLVHQLARAAIDCLADGAGEQRR
jgi:AcrR family transcriptional regulator